MYSILSIVCRSGYVKRGKRKGTGAPGGRIAYFELFSDCLLTHIRLQNMLETCFLAFPHAFCPGKIK